MIDRDGRIYQLVRLDTICRHTVGLNWTAFGIEHVGTSDRQILANRAQLSASLSLTVWLMSTYGIQLRNVIGHNESVTSPYHRETYRAWRCQTHGDWRRSSMQIYRTRSPASPSATAYRTEPQLRPIIRNVPDRCRSIDRRHQAVCGSRSQEGEAQTGHVVPVGAGRSRRARHVVAGRVVGRFGHHARVHRRRFGLWHARSCGSGTRPQGPQTRDACEPHGAMLERQPRCQPNVNQRGRTAQPSRSDSLRNGLSAAIRNRPQALRPCHAEGRGFESIIRST